MNDYYVARVEEVRRLLHATEVKYDVTGVTVRINEQEMFFPVTVIRAMSSLMARAEEEAVDEVRSRLDADRAGASPS